MSWKQDSQRAARRWRGPVERYDLIQEGTIAVVVVLVLVVALSVIFSAPVMHAVTFKQWAAAAPEDFATTTLTELAGTSETATYGPPYNSGTGQVQNIVGNFSMQNVTGVHTPVNAPQEFVIAPLTAFAELNPAIGASLKQWQGADAKQQQVWSQNAISATLKIEGNTVSLTGHGETGPVAPMLSAMLAAAKAGMLDSQLVQSSGNTYSWNLTKPLLYLADGSYLGQIADKYKLKGDQWGIMNEIGSWPGQPWLWWYAMWYNVPGPIRAAHGYSDIYAIMFAMPVVLLILLIPFIPGVRSLPRYLKIYRLIWRPYYKRYGTEPKPEPSPVAPEPPTL
ncbi:MAG: hypothetical protein ACM3VW_00810 [Bacteroidota bacterium]